MTGRRRAAGQLLGTNNMLPAPVKPLYGLYMFPVASDKNEHNIWLSYYAIKHCETLGKCTLVHFKDDTTLEVSVSARILDNQRKKTAQVIAGMAYQLFLNPDEG